MYSTRYDNIFLWGEKSNNTQDQADKKDKLQ